MAPDQNISDFKTNIENTHADKASLKSCLQTAQQKLTVELNHKAPIQNLLRLHSDILDQLLIYLWKNFVGADNNLCLIAVGGYGRQKLYPHSDIDLLILIKPHLPSSIEQKLSHFLTMIWDLGLKVGQSTRTESECLLMSQTDSTIYTNLLEMRFVAGDKAYFTLFQKTFNDHYLWSNKAFFLAKAAEQKNRQSKYNDTAYILEPDIKNSLGGLRDLNHLEWLCLQHFRTADLRCLVKKNILAESDFQILSTAENALAKIRYHLHILNKKSDDRLFFDKQLELARQFGYQEAEKHKAIEAFMKAYFIQVKEIRALHDIVVQYFYEQDLLAEIKPIRLNQTYTLIGDLISQNQGIQITENPQLLLQAFVQLTEIDIATGFTAATLSDIRKHLHLIDDTFRKKPANQQLFIRLFKSKQVFNALQQMNQHKVLEQYLPEFKSIIGQTQHDLFHLYTVDQHSLFVLREIDNLRQEHSLYQKIFNALPNPELLYLSALFHDIGKGKNTDHSQYGAAIAIQFANQHHLPSRQAKLIAWLVNNHLLMSKTAQKNNIHDPRIIQAFVKHVKNHNNLNYLYLLTVADIQATNKTLWNSWKDSLLKQLYFLSSTHLKSQIKKLSISQQIELNKQTVLQNFPVDSLTCIHQLWEQLGDAYFKKETPEHIRWHTLSLLGFDFSEHKALVITHNNKNHGATEIFICRKDCDNLFANTVLLLDQLQLNIVDARIITSANGFCLDTYSVLSRENTMITDSRLLKKIENQISIELSDVNANPKLLQRHMSRQLAHFAHKIKFKFKTLTQQHLTELTIITPDRPGLLAGIGEAFREQQVRVHDAKIATLNNRAEDVFYISDRQNNPFQNKAEQIKLKQSINHYLGLTCNPYKLS